MPKTLPTKPGAERARFRPDVIESYDVDSDTLLLAFLLKSMPNRKRTTVKELLKHNQVAVNGKPLTQFDTPLHRDDVVKINLTREFQIFHHRRMQLVYEDDDIIVVNKGYGLLSMGTDKIKEGTAYSIIRDYLKRKNPNNKIFIIHRLDRDTSGLMMFAKSIEAKERMQHNWNNMVISRKYLAVVEGSVDKPDGAIIRSYLAETSRYEVYSTNNPDKGQLAVTRYRSLKNKNGYSLLEVELDTGRKNQIRVHMKDIGHPIVGDRKYGAKPSPIHRLALHAQTLQFVHPMTHKEMAFTTAIPASFTSMVK